MRPSGRALYRPDSPPFFIKPLWLVTFGTLTILYLLTCQRTVSWQDSGMFQWRVLTGDYAGRIGLALAHPLYIAAGRALTWWAPDATPLILNAFSGVGLAVAMACLAALVATLTGKRWVALATAGIVGVAHTPWWLGTVAEVYTWSAAALAIELLLLVRLLRRPRWTLLVALAAVNGLHLALHNFALLALPVYVAAAIALIVRRRLPRWSLPAAGGAWVLGAGLYLAMIVRLAVVTGDPVAAIRSALFGASYAEDVLNAGRVSGHLTANAVLSGLSFVNLLAPLAVIGWLGLRRRLGTPVALALGAITVIEIAFFVRYPVPDQFTFILPSLLLIGVAAGVGLAALADAGRVRRGIAVGCVAVSLVVPPVFYAAAPRLARRAAPDVAAGRQPCRDELRYWMTPWKHNEDSARRFAVQALREAAPDGVILPDSTSRYPLLLTRRIEGIGEGVLIPSPSEPVPDYDAYPAGFRRFVEDRPIYVVSPAPGRAPDRLLADAEFHRPPGAVLYRLRWKTPATTETADTQPSGSR